jgi:hypothetical protein
MMMRASALAVAAAALAGLPLTSAQAWFHGYSGGGFTRGGTAGGWEHSSTVTSSGVSHSSDFGGYEHGTQVGAGGVAHESDAGGAWHGTAATSQGAYHASDYGGYYHSTAVGPAGAEHTGYYGTTTTAYGAYYHQPATVNYYGTSCYNCGVGWGAAAAGAAVGVAAASAAAAPVTYAALPGGCVYRMQLNAYQCTGTWLAPAYGANGIYYRPIPPP